jgi:hypothetical protein
MSDFDRDKIQLGSRCGRVAATQLRRFAVSRLARTLLVAAVTFCVVAASAGAATTSSLLGNFWTTVLETPSAQNPFATNEPACIDLGGNTVVPFKPSTSPQNTFTCTVQRGTKIFVAASTWECSTFPGDHFDFGTTEAELRECARQNDQKAAPPVTVDGQPASLTAVETGLLSIHLPKDNIFGVTGPPRDGQSVAHGWVVLLNPLAPGTHTITIDIAGTTITTTIIVK